MKIIIVPTLLGCENLIRMHAKHQVQWLAHSKWSLNTDSKEEVGYETVLKEFYGWKDGRHHPIPREWMSYVTEVGMPFLEGGDMNLAELEHSLRRIRFFKYIGM